MLKIRRSVNCGSLIRHFASQSTQPAPKEQPSEYEDSQLKEFQRISNIQRKIRTRKPQKPPFAKNLLLGVFDTDLLAYPEINNEDLNNLNRTVDEVQGVLQQSLVSECTKISKDFLKKLARGRVLGLQSSQLMNGRELTVTESCRIFELLSEHNLKNALINNETLGVQTLVKFGNEYLQRKYLQRLIDGDSLSAFCVVEPLPSKIDVFKVTAAKSGDGKSWVLNGRRKLVVNGSDADIYVVVANTDCNIKDEIREQKYSVFLVERDFGGVTTSRKNTEGAFELSDVVFENTVIPNENLIGEEEGGEKILSAIYSEYRLGVGPVCSVLLKRLINNMTQHYINISEGPNFLHETDAVRLKMGEFSSSLYVLDSMIYLTSGLMDQYENQDVELESCILKIFASEQALRISSTCVNLIGPDACLPGHWCNQIYKEALAQVTLNDSNDNLKILTALFGLRYAGQHVADIIKKIRNPLFNFSFAIKRMWVQRKQVDDDPILNLYLHHYLHPSCIHSAKRLEYCVLRLQYATEVFLARNGSEIVNKHGELRMLAECLIDIYAMTAAIGRASRSYCIGLQHGEYEVVLASAFILDATRRVQQKLRIIVDGPYLNTDENFKITAKRLFELKQYYPVHPLTRNF